MIFQILSAPLEQGLAYVTLALAVYITYRILDFPDLTVDGSLPLGAAVAARLIAAGTDPLLASAAAIPLGLAAGALTGLLHTRLKISGLLSGILTMTALYSVNLRIMGRPNIPLITAPTLFTRFPGLSPAFIFGAAALASGCLVFGFFKTEYGLAVRATGVNRGMAAAQGVNCDAATIVGLSLSNALAALCGALVAQYQGFADIGMGIGTVIAGLASVIIGGALAGRRGLLVGVAGAAAGSLVYRFTVFGALRLGFQPTDLKLVTAVIVVLALGLPSVVKGAKLRKPATDGRGRMGDVRNASVERSA